jgi:hypothetical protein
MSLEIRVLCDRCGNSLESDSINHFDDYLEDEGWLAIPGHEWHYCPDCKIKNMCRDDEATIEIGEQT